MWKRYLKRLWNTFSFALGYVFMMFFIGFLCYLVIFPRLPLQKLIPEKILSILLASISLVLMLVFLYRTRRSDKQVRREYVKKLKFPPPSFAKDFWQTLKSRDNIAHTLAFLTLDLLFVLLIGISASSTLWAFLFGALTFLITQGAVFTLINTFIWSLVHRRWIEYWQNTAV
jgi:membrane protease YdiL (CAAX protease family)